VAHVGDDAVDVDDRQWPFDGRNVRCDAAGAVASPAMAVADTTTLKRGTRVIVSSPIAGVPEGTGGRVTARIGLTLPRYRVAFDNGVATTSVAHTKLVREQDWDEFLAERARAAEEAERAAAAPPPVAAPAATGTDTAAAAGGDDRLAALMARSKAARAKKTGDDGDAAGDATPSDATPAGEAAAGGGDDAVDAAAADPRLAALMARSKAARAAKEG
jgi:hypothetical protein